MTSSLRNSLHRRNHKERGQLAHRARLGILEKHADYVKRARDYHSKQDRLNRLKQKAAERNKDEFYFSMVNEKTRGGVHIKDRGNASLPTDIVKVLKTQDENYVRTMRASNLKKIDQVKTQLTTLINLLKPASLITVHESDELTDGELKVLSEAGIISDKSKSALRRRKPGHIVFADTKEEVDQIKARDTKQHAPTISLPPRTEIDLGWKVPARKHPQAVSPLSLDEEQGGEQEDEQEDSTATRRRLLKELSARLTRDHQLRSAQREFELQRLMMGKGARKRISATLVEGAENDQEDEDALDAMKGKHPKANKVHDETYKPRVYKWKLERK